MTNKIASALRIAANGWREAVDGAVVINASLTMGADGKPICSNWGDDINWWFLRHISVKPIVIYNRSVLARAGIKDNILAIGSVIGMLNNRHSIIWGAGIMDSTLKSIVPPKEVKAVRGPLTRRKLLDMGVDCPEVYGDPALLLPRYYKPSLAKKHRLGVIAHYVDRQAAEEAFAGQDVSMIDIKGYTDWHDFIDRIVECEGIVSSSLHGLIIAEAYGIPAVWVEFAGSDPRDRFKYHDFYGSLNREAEPVVIKTPADIAAVQDALVAWRPSRFDTDPLLEAAPFTIHHPPYY